MATQSLTRSLLSKPKTLTIFLFSRPFSAASSSAVPRPSLSLISRIRPLSVAVPSVGLRRQSFRCFSASPPPNSISDSNPNLSNRPPKESILLDGCDFEHWLVVVEKPQGDPTRDEIIDSYIKTLAKVVGSEEEARQKIYSVSTRCYYAFGCLVNEELSYKIKEIPGVRWVLPDSYLDVKNKDYGGEPFINGEAVPYDPKYHEEWIRNNARATERNKRNDRPRAHDNSRTFERRRDNMQNPSPNQQAQNQGYQNRPRPNQSMQNQGYQNRPGPNQPMQNQGYQNRPGPNQPMQNQGYQNRPGPNQPMQNQGYQNRPGPNQPMQNQGYQNRPVQNQGYLNHPEHNQGYPNHSAQDQGYQNQDFQYSHKASQPIQNQGMQNTPPMPPNNGGAPFSNGEMPPNYAGPNATGGMQPDYTGGMPPNASMSEMPPNATMSEMPPSGMKWDKPSNAGATPPDAGWPDNSPNRAAAAGGGYPQN